jgi:hypothetical protein
MGQPHGATGGGGCQSRQAGGGGYSGSGATAARRRGEVISGATGRSGSPRRLFYGDGRSTEGGSPVRGRRSDGGWSWSCQRASRGRGKAHGTVGWAGGRPEVWGRRCGALTAGADGVSSALVTSCGDGLAHGEAPVDDDPWHTRTAARRCLRWLISCRGTMKKSSSDNARIDRAGA